MYNTQVHVPHEKQQSIKKSESVYYLPTLTYMGRKRSCFYVLFMCRRIGEYTSLELF